MSKYDGFYYINHFFGKNRNPDLFYEDWEGHNESYSIFFINLCLSQSIKTVLYAYHARTITDKLTHFLFMCEMLPPDKVYLKWAKKKEKEEDDMKIVSFLSDHFNIDIDKAVGYMQRLSEDTKKDLMLRLSDV